MIDLGEEALLTAVADPMRRKLLDALLTRGEASASVLADHVPVTRQAVTKHLAVLDRVGLVERRRQGREVRYAVRPDRLNTAAEAMVRVAADWDLRLQSIKRIAESVHRERREND